MASYDGNVGDTLILRYEFSSGRDLSGETFTLKVRETRSSATVLQEAAVNMTEAADGVVMFTLSGVQTAALGRGSWAFATQQTIPGVGTFTFDSGHVTFAVSGTPTGIIVVRVDEDASLEPGRQIVRVRSGQMALVAGGIVGELITQAEYDALATPDPTTAYFIYA